MFAETGLLLKQEFVDAVAAEQRRFERVGEFAGDPLQRALHHRIVVVAGLATPLPCQRQRARIETGRQGKGTLAQLIGQVGIEARWRCRLQVPAGQCTQRPLREQFVVGR